MVQQPPLCYARFPDMAPISPLRRFRKTPISGFVETETTSCQTVVAVTRCAWIRVRYSRRRAPVHPTLTAVFAGCAPSDPATADPGEPAATVARPATVPPVKASSRRRYFRLCWDGVVVTGGNANSLYHAGKYLDVDAARPGARRPNRRGAPLRDRRRHRRAHPGTQTVVFAATEHDSLYAFNITTGRPSGKTSLLRPGEAPFTSAITQSYTGGITSTPVIDPSTNTIYVVTTESYRCGECLSIIPITLHAVDMSDGMEQPGSPVMIADTGYVGGKAVSFAGPTVAGTGAGSVGRAGVLLRAGAVATHGPSIVGNNLLISFASYGDHPPYHGWILAYDKNSLRSTAVFNDTPNGSDGGIWNDGNPIQVDSQGYLYTETGNGTFDTRLNRKGLPSRGDYGDSVLKLALDPGYNGINGSGIRVVDYFTPDNQAN